MLTRRAALFTVAAMAGWCFCSTGAHADELDETHPAEVGQLLEQRLETLRELVKAIDAAHQQGRASYEAVIHAKERVLDAKLQTATGRAARLSILQERVTLREELVTMSKAGFEQGLIPKDRLLVAQADLLEAKIEVARLTEPAGHAADLAPPVQLMADGKPIEVEGFAAPNVGDFDNDGTRDLLIGQYVLGRLRVYRNVGSNAQPKFGDFEWFTAGGEIAGVPNCCQVAFTPQLVDFDGDGHSDVLTGSGIAGELFLFRRSSNGDFEQPEVLRNMDGEVQLHRWSSSGRRSVRRYNVTASAYDWDKDGDLDLLLGYVPLCLVLNEGSSAEPRFDGGHVLACNGEPILGQLGAPQMADWDGDGRDDLITGACRDIVWYRNVGERGEPKFESPRVLVPSVTPAPNVEASPGQPGCHHAFSVCDFNADGRLDLLVGDRFVNTVELEGALSEPDTAERERLDALRECYEDLRKEPQSETRGERIERYRQLLKAWQQYETQILAWNQQLPRRQVHRGYVWYFERTAPTVVE